MPSTSTALSILLPPSEAVSCKSSTIYTTADDFIVPEKASKRIAAIGAHLKDLHEIMIETINRRDFDPTGKIWQHYGDPIYVDACVPGFGFTQEFHGQISLQDFLSKLPDTFGPRPSMKYIVNSRDIVFSRGAKRARMTIYAETIGNMEGIRAEAATAVDWELRNGKWLVESIKNVQGIDLVNVDES